MNDFYFKFAHTTIGQNIFQTLSLPQPVLLNRTPDESISMPKGTYLVGASSGSFALKNVLSALKQNNSNIDFLDSGNPIYQSLPKSFSSSNTVHEINTLEGGNYDGLVFDATGIKDFESLSGVYSFFHHAIKKLNQNGRIIIITNSPKQLSEPQLEAIQLSLHGFSKSLAKELGKKGTCCNILCLPKGSQKYIESSLAFFLSEKSAFVTGQSVTLRNQTTKQVPLSSEKPLIGKTALVTGAAQGIGKQTAITLARDGAKVICLDIPQNKEPLEALANELDGHALTINLLDESAILDIIEEVRKSFNGLDIVVHNAGITRDKTLGKMPQHLWDQVITLNFERVVKMNQSFLEQDLFNEYARIICISSISGIAGNFGQTNYACSKAGIAAYVEAFSESTAVKKCNGLTINALAPGFIETQMTKNVPLLTRELGRRMNALSQGGLPLDIAEAVCFFANPGAHSLNGNVLRVCGLSLLGR
tara:strand:+ start:11542 stop:12969 length:1428 start_codon:yes stop_codon:yes gene_type:complete